MLTGLLYKGPIAMQSAATGTGNGTAVDCLENDNGAFESLVIQVTGINGDTITWEATIDGTNYAAFMVTPLATGTAATTATANGIYRATVTGLLKVRARISTYGSGTVYVTAFAVA